MLLVHWASSGLGQWGDEANSKHLTDNLSNTLFALSDFVFHGSAFRPTRSEKPVTVLRIRSLCETAHVD